MKLIISILLLTMLFLLGCAPGKYDIRDLNEIPNCEIRDGQIISNNPSQGSRVLNCDEGERTAGVQYIVAKSKGFFKDERNDVSSFNIREEKGVIKNIILNETRICQGGGELRLLFMSTLFTDEYELNPSSTTEINKTYYISIGGFLDDNLGAAAITSNPTREDLDEVNALTLFNKLGIIC